MDQITRSKLIALLKSNKLLPKFEKEVEKMRVKRDCYFDWVESIYAISRIIPNASDDNLRHKLTEVNKVWVRMVITDDMCPQLRPYFDKYGQEAVYNAVSYLLEKNAWVSPVDDKGLKAKMPSNYDGLRDIDETVDMLKEEEAYKSKSQKVEKSEEPKSQKVEETKSEVSPLPIDTEALKQQFKEFNDAERAFLDLGAALDKAKELHAAFNKLVRQDEILEMYEQENLRLTHNKCVLEEKLRDMTELRDQNSESWRKTLDKQDEEFAKREEQYKKEISEAKSTTETVRKELERERRLHKEDNDRAYQNRLAKERAEKELEALKVEHESTVTALTELRRLAKDASQTPAFKIIPMEELDTLYGMGAKMKSVLLPFMEKHGIRFLTEDERKKLKRSPR